MYFAIRRIFELIICLIALIILTPILLIIAIAVRADSKGPVIFKQERIGKKGKIFKMYKFRTMIVGAQNMGSGVYSFEGDSRITRVGKFLRKTSLDELPQLWNIVIGNMSLIGPRAPVYGHFPQYDTLNDEYKRRFSVKPGITGLAQVVGRNDFSWDEKVKYDNIYIDKVKKYGPLFDLKIIFLTIGRVFSMSDVSEKKENMELNNTSLEIVNTVKNETENNKINDSEEK